MSSSSVCPICLEDCISLVILPDCKHSACKDCLSTWFQQQEEEVLVGNSSTPTCPECHSAVTSLDLQVVLGRPFRYRKKRRLEANSSPPPSRTKSNNTTIDDASQKWLDANTLECGNCQGRIMKESGCDKLQCICGYRVCWNCQTPNADCSCNPGHLFHDNVKGFPTVSAPVLASADDLLDIKPFLEKNRATGLSSALSLGLFHTTNAAMPPRTAVGMPRLLAAVTPIPPLATTATAMPLFTKLQKSMDRKRKVIESIIRDDLSLAMEHYQRELQDDDNDGSPPSWARELAFFLRCYGQAHKLPWSELESLFPGVKLSRTTE